MSLTIADDQEVLLTAGHVDAAQATTSSRITWSSSSPGVVSIEDNGDGTAWAVAKSPGTARITATAEDSGKESPAYEIDVTGGATDSVVVTAGAPTRKGQRAGSSAAALPGPQPGGGATGTAAVGTTPAPTPGSPGGPPLPGTSDPGAAIPAPGTPAGPATGTGNTFTTPGTTPTAP